MERNDNQSEHDKTASMDTRDSLRPEPNENSRERELPAQPLLADAPPNGIERRRTERRRIERLSTDL